MRLIQKNAEMPIDKRGKKGKKSFCLFWQW